jgi:hypothetical protein
MGVRAVHTYNPEVVTETPWQRFRHRVLSLFVTKVRPATATERSLMESLESARREAEAADQNAANYKRELAAKTAELEIAKLSVDNLTLVCARDRQRVQAEIAEYARREAEAEGRRQP